MKQDTQNGMERVNINVDQMQAFLILKNAGMMINAGVNANNQLIKVYVTKYLFGIRVIVSVNVINPMILLSIQTIKIASAKKS